MGWGFGVGASGLGVLGSGVLGLGFVDWDLRFGGGGFEFRQPEPPEEILENPPLFWDSRLAALANAPT